MLDKRTEIMLQMASTLTAEDLDYVRGVMPGKNADCLPGAPQGEEVDCEREATPSEQKRGRRRGKTRDAAPDAATATASATAVAMAAPASTAPPSGDPSRGARERQRTRESKVSTTCVGQPRTPHPWWPIDTELEGRINGEVFTATVVENSQVKSGKSVLITTGAAQGRVCITPTRAAIEATEEYRRIANLGRGGGVTNGWSFWKPKQ